jgi:hypothetical protein
MVVGLILFGLLGYALLREHRARTDAHAFCDAVTVGAPMAPIRIGAQGLGMDRLRHIGDERVVIGFMGIPPFSRHLCTVYAEDGRVTSAEYFYLD